MKENKIKVLFFMDGIGNAGGIQEMAIKWMENIDREKVQIDILSYNSGKSDNYIERVEAFGGKVYVIQTYMHKGCILESFRQTKEFFRTHKYDILHAHSSSKALFIMYYAKKYGIKTRILHSHCTKFIIEGHVAKTIATLMKIPTVGLTTEFYACSSEAGEFLFGKKALNTKQITIAHNGINVELFKPDTIKRNLVRKELEIEHNFVIGNVGRFRPQKNHDFLIDIFKEICEKDSSAVLVCVGNGELEDKIKEKSKKLGIYDRIRFLGFRTDINDIMQAFDVLVMPSLYEGLPVTGVEAQAIGIPAIFSDTITKEAAILPTSCYMPLKASPQAWSKKILEYRTIKHEEEPHIFIKERGYDIHNETKKLEKFYQQCMK